MYNVKKEAHLYEIYVKEKRRKAMKKAAAAVVLLAAVFLAAEGLVKVGVFDTFVADVQAEGGTAEEDRKEERIAQIDTLVPVQAGSRIAVVSKSVAGEFWDLIRQGMEEAVEDINTAYGFTSEDKLTMTFEGPDDELNVEEQVNTLDAVIAENPAVLCLSASDMDSLQAQLEAAAENDIPVIAFDSNVSENQLVTAFRATDNEYVGELAGEKMAEALGEKGTVLVFSAQEKTESAQKRVSGFREALSEFPEIEIADIIYMDQVDDMKSAMQEAMETYTDVTGVFCTNADTSDLYLELEKAEEPPVFIGVDATSSQQEAVRSGDELGIVSQDPWDIGYQTILAAVQVTDPDDEGGESLEKTVLLEPAWIDSSNIDDPQYSNYIYK